MHVSGLQTVVVTIEELTIKVSWIIKAVFESRPLFFQGSYCLDFFNLYVPLLNISFSQQWNSGNSFFYFSELLCVGQVVTCLLFWLFLGITEQTSIFDTMIPPISYFLFYKTSVFFPPVFSLTNKCVHGSAY